MLPHRFLLLALVALLSFPAAAAAAPEKPVAITGGAANVGQSTVTLNGVVNPKEAETTYFFQYGTTSLYGAQTPTVSAGSGDRRVRVAANVAGLAPATTYHYRLVARNGKGLTKGRDRTFRTQRQPLGVTLAATPNPIDAGGSVTLAGALTGTGNGGRQVALQANPYPYTQGFRTVGNVQITNDAGGFAFPLLSVPVNTQYRVLMANRPDVVSPVVVLGTKVRVTTRKSVRRWERRGRVRLSGRITPAAAGSEVLIQKRRDGEWETIRRTFARAAATEYSTYAKKFKQKHGGRYRVVANVQGAHVADIGRTVRVKRVKRR
jgi:hypothetical protein